MILRRDAFNTYTIIAFPSIRALISTSTAVIVIRVQICLARGTVNNTDAIGTVLAGVAPLPAVPAVILAAGHVYTGTVAILCGCQAPDGYAARLYHERCRWQGN